MNLDLFDDGQWLPLDHFQDLITKTPDHPRHRGRTLVDRRRAALFIYGLPSEGFFQFSDHVIKGNTTATQLLPLSNIAIDQLRSPDERRARGRDLEGRELHRLVSVLTRQVLGLELGAVDIDLIAGPPAERMAYLCVLFTFYRLAGKPVDDALTWQPY